MKYQIGELSEGHQNYNRNTEREQKKLPAAEAVKKAHL